MWVWGAHRYPFTHTGMGMGRFPTRGRVWSRVWVLICPIGYGFRWLKPMGIIPIDIFTHIASLYDSLVWSPIINTTLHVPLVLEDWY
jgi:hypothetical protein